MKAHSQKHLRQGRFHHRYILSLQLKGTMKPRGSPLQHLSPKALPMSVKLRFYRPVLRATAIHKRVDETLQFIVINNDVLQLLLHNSYISKAHSALSIMQDDLSIVSKAILLIKITRILHDTFFRTYRRRLDAEVKARGPMFSVLLGILTYLIFADNCSTQKDST